MNIETLPVGFYQENCSIIWKTDQALVIDPGFDPQWISNVLNEQKLTVAAFLCTHAHADHISALAPLHAERPAPIYMHPADRQWAFAKHNQIPPYYSVPQPPDAELLDFTAQEHWNFADLSLQIIHTPGHTPGSLCLYFPEGELLISGDTLFKGTCGRTDLPGGSARQLSNSLKLLKELPHATTVYPGHGPTTTIGEEKQFNLFMR